MKLITDPNHQAYTDWYFECPKCSKTCKPGHPDPECFDCGVKLKYKEEKRCYTFFRFYCPICDSWKEGSDYLFQVISSKNQLWIANMVTHYRHNHIRYWDNSVNYISKFLDYDLQKQIVNERCKRNIIRKCRETMNNEDITAEDVKNLSPDTEQKTADLADKYLTKEIQ